MSGAKQIYCTSCTIYVRGQEEYKLHFQSDFHKYNSKRKLVSLLPVSYEDFEAKKNRKLEFCCMHRGAQQLVQRRL